MLSGLKAPARLPSGAALKPGEKGRSPIDFGQAPPPGSEFSAKLLFGVAAGLPDQGTITALVWFGPQVGGLLRTAGRGEPLKLRTKEVNGTCGASVIVVASWPVTGLART